MGKEDPLEKGMATHSSILAWKIPWTENPMDWQATVPGVTKSQTQLYDKEHSCPWAAQISDSLFLV